MMKNNILNIESTSTTPEIHIDYEKGYMKISGKSLLDDVADFYYPITQRVKVIPNLVLDVDIEYLNSSSVFHLMVMITTELKLSSVTWYHHKDDEDIQETGINIQEIIEVENLGIEFNVIEK